MIKKITAYSFILLANIVLLAHAVVPHHHHETQVCIEKTHCETDFEAHKHQPNEENHKHNHEHDGNNGSLCVLKQAIVLPVHQSRQLDGCSDCSDNHNHDFFIFSDFGYVDLQPDFEVVTYIPEFSSFLISFVTTSHGLRAPPLV
jgi:hypothetical protein